MEKAVLIKKIKNKFISKEEKFKNYYKKSYSIYQFLKNIADTKIEKEGFFRAAGLHICKSCMKELYECLATKIVPKSPENMLNKKVKLSKEKNFEK